MTDYEDMSDYDLIIRFGRCWCQAPRLVKKTEEDGVILTFTCRNGHEA